MPFSGFVLPFVSLDAVQLMPPIIGQSLAGICLLANIQPAVCYGCQRTEFRD